MNERKGSNNGWCLKQIIFGLCLCIIGIFAGSGQVQAANGIAGNGTGGIYIDINAAPYTTFSNYSWGQYAYGPSGCAWFASARVNQLTGKGSVIYSGQSWYNSAYSAYGFSRGGSPQAPALVCWSGHVAVLEKIVGNTAYISEGGNTSYPGNSYCVIRTVNVGSLAGLNAGFLGYVYLGNGSSSSGPNVYFADQNVNGTWDTNAEVYVKVMNPDRASVTRVGCYLYKNGTLVKSYYEDCNYTTSYVNYNCNINNDMHYTLSRGTTYQYVLYAVVNGKEYRDSARSFTTTGSNDSQAPVISDVILETVSNEQWIIKCRASDNISVNRVQFPTWTKHNGQDDLQANWVNNPKASGVKQGNYYCYTVKTSDHNKERGTYYTHIYAYDNVGNYTRFELPQIVVPETTGTGLTNSQVIHELTVGDAKQLNCGLQANWISSNANVVSVDKTTGLIRAVAPGETVIKATAGGVSWTVKIRVKAAQQTNNNVSTGESSEKPAPQNPITNSVNVIVQGGKTYCYDGNGNLIRNKMQNIKGYYYYFDKNGVMQTNRLIRIGNRYYYCAHNGAVIRNRLQRIGRNYYYAASNGVILQNRFQRIGKYYYYFAKNGAMVKNRFVKAGRCYYYLAANGVMLQNRLVRIGRYYYYFDAHGRMRTGWVRIGNHYYYFNTRGIFVKKI